MKRVKGKRILTVKAAAAVPVVIEIQEEEKVHLYSKKNSMESQVAIMKKEVGAKREEEVAIVQAIGFL